MFSSWFGKKQPDKTPAEPPPAVAVVDPPPEPPPHAAADVAADAAVSAAPDAGTLAPHGLNVDALLAPPTPAANANAQPEVGPADAVQTDALKPPVVEAISTVFDPEIPVNIYELGLIYEIIVDAERRVGVRMTLTSPACPSAQQIPSEVRYKVKAIEGVTDCTVDVVWEPPWTKEMMSEAAKLSLGLF
jgi:FeS assembly SUF system protein